LINPFPDPDEVDYIKRVIAIPGDRIDIREGMVSINGKKLTEPYVKGGVTDNKGMAFPRTVPSGKLFVMGDNRQVSRDSREIGYIDIKKIRGRAVFSIWPLDRFGLLR
jgi:signal peptidase I